MNRRIELALLSLNALALAAVVASEKAGPSGLDRFFRTIRLLELGGAVGAASVVSVAVLWIRDRKPDWLGGILLVYCLSVAALFLLVFQLASRPMF